MECERIMNQIATQDAEPRLPQGPEARDACESMLLHIRAQLSQAMAEQGVDRAELARRLGVETQEVDQVLDDTDDVFASAMFQIAWALGMEWKASLHHHEQGAQP
jgi:hypothetical protein